MRITEGQLRRIIREELNEMGMTFRPKPGVSLGGVKPGDRLPASMFDEPEEDFPGEGAETARRVMRARMPASPADLGSRFDTMLKNLDLDEPEEDPYEGAAFSKEEIEDIQRGMYGRRR